MPQLFLLSGPSCVGKSPLLKALKMLYPEMGNRIKKLILYNDRAIRPGEQDGVDYHFRSRKEIEALKDDDNFVVIPVRNDLQALDVNDVHKILNTGNDAFYEGAPYVVNAIKEHKSFQLVPMKSVFLSPLNHEEIVHFQSINADLENLVIDIMRKKQLRRKQKQMGLISLVDLEDIEMRCQAAYQELKEAHKYDYVIPNHDGEDSEHWSQFGHPIGDARRAVVEVVKIMHGEKSDYAEKWDVGLLK